MGGPDVPIKFGRLDHTDDSNVPPNGRLPDATQGTNHLRDVFYRMGFNDQEIVALSGAHNLGRCHGDRSGFEGPWVHSPTRFGNTYFRLLLNEDWKQKTNKQGLMQYRDEDDELMMLPTDYALIKDEKMRPWVEKYADDKELFYKDFSAAFAKLIELGIDRDEQGNVTKKGLQNGDRVDVHGAHRHVTEKPRAKL
jgi:peroxiredoxin